MAKAPSMRCPHCQAAASARTSRSMSRMYREVTYVCRNLKCGHVFVAGLEALRTLSPSAVPHPEVTLPLARSIRVGQLVHQLEQAATAQATAGEDADDVATGPPLQAAVG